MKTNPTLIALLSAIALTMLAGPANAQASRTFVSGVGDNANPCRRTAPCLTFAGTIAKTATGGEMDCLDPGEFGVLTVTRSMVIDCEDTSGNIFASSANGITISTPGISVTVRGLNINGLGTGVVGINVTAASTLYVRDSVISGFQGGAATGISVTGGGTLVVTDTVIHSNGSGIALNGSSGSVKMTLRDVIVHSNSTNGVSIGASGATTQAMIDHTTLASNTGTGLLVNGSTVTAQIGNSTITGNGTGVSVTAGTLYSFKDNQIAGNTVNGNRIALFPGPGGAFQ